MGQMGIKISLLIAEDEERVRESIRTFTAKNAPFIDEIFIAENGQQALDIIFQYHPDCLLLDIKMPVKDGISVMKEASEAGVLPNTIILSGFDEFEYVQAALRYGAMDYLLKPCRSSEILLAIERAAKRPRQREPVFQTHTETGNSSINEALVFMNRHYPDELTLSKVAEHVGITPNYLSTLFRRTMGCGFVDCLNKIRMDRACDYFADNRMKTYEVAFKVGYHDEKYFSSLFKKIKGISPSEYRKRARSDYYAIKSNNNDVSKQQKE